MPRSRTRASTATWPDPPPPRSAAPSRRHRATRLRAVAAGLGARLAVRVLMAPAFGAAGIADGGAHRADRGRHRAVALHGADRQPAGRRAVDIERDAAGHHADVRLLQARGEALV